MKRAELHNPQADRTCKRCGMFIKAFIPHECDPSICPKCDGKHTVYKGRNRATNEWIGYVPCDACDGTGRTIWKD